MTAVQFAALGYCVHILLKGLWMNKDLCHSPHNFIRNVDIVHWNKTGQTTQCVDKTKLPPKTCAEGQRRKKVIINAAKAYEANYISEVITSTTTTLFAPALH